MERDDGGSVTLADDGALFGDVASLIDGARQQVATAVNRVIKKWLSYRER